MIPKYELSVSDIQSVIKQGRMHEEMYFGCEIFGITISCWDYKKRVGANKNDGNEIRALSQVQQPDEVRTRRHRYVLHSQIQKNKEA